MYGEHEKDPTVIFAELDKGLHSIRIGEQCTAIVRFPRLFDKHPFPILIKSAFVKLANVFRTGNNFMRLCVLQVAKSSSHHLQKIGNVDEIVRCIYGVLHSNDPVARSLTLRLLGCLSGIVGEKKNIEQAIIVSLDSHDELELLAALDAASAYVAKSRSMSISICDKLSLMTENISFPIHLKLRMIHIFEKMDCDLDTAIKVRKLCEMMLKEYPVTRFSIVLLHTLTLLVVRTSIFIEDQMELLLEYFEKSHDHGVKTECLDGLLHIARHAPHYWQSKHIQNICKLIAIEEKDSLKIKFFLIVDCLTRKSSIHFLKDIIGDGIENNIIIDVCKGTVYHSDPYLSVIVYQILVNITIYFYKPSMNNELEIFLLDIVCITSSLMTSLILNDVRDESIAFKKYLKSTSLLCIHCNFTYTTDILSCLFSVISSNITAKKLVLLCECLSSIADVHASTIASWSPEIISLLEKYLNSNLAEAELSQDVLYCLARVLLQVTTPIKMSSEFEDKVLKTLIDCLKPWQRFKLARCAMRYAHFMLANEIIKNLETMVSIDSYQIWMSALRQYCTGEMHLENIRRLNNNSHKDAFSSKELQQKSFLINLLFCAESSFLETRTLLQAAVSSTNSFSFQIEYCELRATLCTCFARVLHCCAAFRINPPPAIATSLAISTNCDSHRCQHIIAQFKTVHEKFILLENNYLNFYKKLFDADATTICHIRILTEICQLMNFLFQQILKDNNLTTEINENTNKDMKDDSEDGNMFRGDLNCWLHTRKKIIEKFHGLDEFKHSILTSQLITFVEEITMQLSTLRLESPRYFFQRLWFTDIKLTVSPTPKSSADAIVVKLDESLAIKVEGILHTTHPPKRIQSASFHLLLKSRTTPDTKNHQQDTKLSNSCKLINDYICANFLLNLPSLGFYDIYIETSLMDSLGVVWLVGQPCHFVVQAIGDRNKLK